MVIHQNMAFLYQGNGIWLRSTMVYCVSLLRT